MAFFRFFRQKSPTARALSKAQKKQASAIKARTRFSQVNAKIRAKIKAAVEKQRKKIRGKREAVKAKEAKSRRKLEKAQNAWFFKKARQSFWQRRLAKIQARKQRLKEIKVPELARAKRAQLSEKYNQSYSSKRARLLLKRQLANRKLAKERTPLRKEFNNAKQLLSRRLEETIRNDMKKRDRLGIKRGVVVTAGRVNFSSLSSIFETIKTPAQLLDFGAKLNRISKLMKKWEYGQAAEIIYKMKPYKPSAPRKQTVQRIEQARIIQPEPQEEPAGV